MRGCAKNTTVRLFQEMDLRKGCMKLENGKLECLCNMPKCNFKCKEKQPCKTSMTSNTTEICNDDCKSMETIKIEEAINATKAPTDPPATDDATKTLMIQNSMLFAFSLMTILY